MLYKTALSKCGDFGIYQRFLLILLIYPFFFSLFINLGFSFWAAKPGFKCAEFGSMADNFTLKKSEINLELVNNSKIMLKNKSTINQNLPFNLSSTSDHIDSCFVLLESNISVNSLLANRTFVESGKDKKPCERWTYDKKIFDSTIISQWDLVCDKKYLVSLSQSLYMTGYLLGSLIFGSFSDKFGRKKSLTVTALGVVIFSTVQPWVPNVTLFLVVRLLLSTFALGQSISSFVLALELVGERWRVFVGMMFMNSWALGYFGLSALAYFIRNHFYLQIAISIGVLPLFIMIALVPESPQWLVANKRTDEARKILLKMAKVNKIRLTDSFTLHSENTPNEKVNIFDLFRRRRSCKNTIVLFFCWTVMNFVFYGLSFNTSGLAGNVFFNFAMYGVMELIAYNIGLVVLYKLGRKLPHIVMFMFAGASMLLLAVLPSDIKVFATILAMLGKFFIAMAFGTIYMYTTEMYPTVARTTALGACSFMSRIGGIVAPYYSDLADIHRSIPAVLAGLLSLAAGLSIILLPETKGMDFFDTFQECEEAEKKQTLVSCFRRKAESDNLSGEESKEMMENHVIKNT